MKRLALLITIALGAGCTQPNSVLLLNARQLDSDCSPGSNYIGHGSLDTSLGSQYTASFEVQSELDASPITVDDEVLLPATRNDFIVERAVITYGTYAATGAVTPVGATSFLPLFAVIPAGSRRAESFINMNLINASNLATFLATAPVPSEMAVDVRLEGRLQGGQTMQTNTVRFPISLTGANALCDATVPDVCGNLGQDCR